MNNNLNNTFSFLPEDTITPAVQNLGKTLGAINQQKIAQQEDLQKKFAALLDVSYENIMAKHQNEVMQDWDKFKSHAVDVFRSASESGMPINQNEYAKVIKEHNDVVRKAEYARQLKQDYYKTMAEATKLDAVNKLDPESKLALENWKNKGGNIYDLPAPSSLIQTQYSPMEVATIEKGMYNDQTLLKKVQTKMPGGYINTSDYYDPKNIAQVATDRVKTDPDFAKFVSKNYGTLQNYITAKQEIYDKQYQGLKLAAQPPVIELNRPTPAPGGGNLYKPRPEYQGVKTYTINGTVKKGQLADYNDRTGEVQFVPQKKVLKSDRAADIEYYEQKLDDKDVKKDPKQVKSYEDKINAIKADDKNYTITLDNDNVETYHINDIVGAKNAYVKATNRGGQKLNIPQTGKKYIGANGKEYDESDFAGMDIQKLIKDKKIKPK